MGTTANAQLPYPELSATADVNRDIKALAEKLDTLMPGAIPIGGLVLWMATAAPAKWLLCNGASYAIATWPQLGAVLGESPTGSGNFKVPDLVGRVAVGSGAGWTLGMQGGAQTVALSTPQLPVHAHSITDVVHGHAASAGYTGASDRGLGHSHSYFAGGNNASFTTGSGAAVSRAVQGGWTSSGGEGAPDHLHAPPAITVNGSGSGITGTNNAGSGSPHENMPPYQIVTYIIRAG